ncbi:MAG: TetR/AcrR family transcriptional regulator [Pseudomonadota bacterium]
MSKSAGAAPAYQRRRDARPGEILDAALDEFFAEGFSKASMAGIARRAGVSRATIYLYFESKDALFEAVANAAMDSMLGALSATNLGDHPGSTRDILQELLGRFYSTIVNSKNSALMRILVAEGKSHPDLVRRYHALILKRADGALSALIERGIARGELRDGAATSIPKLIVAPAFMFLMHSMVFSEVEDLDAEAFSEAHFDMLLNGIFTGQGD